MAETTKTDKTATEPNTELEGRLYEAEGRIAELERKVAELEAANANAVTTEQFLAWCDETLPDIINKAVAKLSEDGKPGKGVTKREVENMLHERRFEHMKTGPESAP